LASFMTATLREALPEPARRVLRKVRAKLLSVGISRGVEFRQPASETDASASMSIIVAINDSPEVVQRCLASLEKFAPRSEVVLVDDGSALRQTVDLIEAFRARNSWKHIRHEVPQGHSQCCSVGARQSTRPYLCLLNSDTVVAPWSWQGIKEAFELDPSIGIAGPSTSWAATRQMITRAMYCRHYWSDEQINAFAHAVVAGNRLKPCIDLEEASGCAFFIRRGLWEQLGGFDPNLPDYGNESELCMRVLQAGWRIVWVPGSYIHHFGRQSYGREEHSALLGRWAAARRYIDSKHASCRPTDARP
jgi:GT2 family glycosyltransferase